MNNSLQTISLFGGQPKKDSNPEPVKQRPAAKQSFGFSFGSGGNKAADKKVPVDIPSVVRFKQNKDGSITGIVKNSKNFRNGTEITTSPVKRGAKIGDIVTTSSGSKYKLE